MAEACDPLLPEVPIDADIRTFDLGGIVATELFDGACRVRGVLMPVATKVLHRKRPGWIPMLDNVILFACLDLIGRPGMKGRSQEGETAAEVGVFAMNAFCRDLGAVEDDIEIVREVLAAEGTPMTAVRVLEVAVWMATEPLGQYR